VGVAKWISLLSFSEIDVCKDKKTIGYCKNRKLKELAARNGKPRRGPGFSAFLSLTYILIIAGGA
jgi:hypothetical protein